MASISAASIPKLSQTDAQGLSNTAWAFATLLFRDTPLFDAIAAEARRSCRSINEQSITTLIWSWWKLSRSPEAWPMVEHGVSRGVPLDSMGFAYGLMLAEWEKEEC